MSTRRWQVIVRVQQKHVRQLPLEQAQFAAGMDGGNMLFEVILARLLAAVM
ncbi:hypothetical protein D3C81_2338740 [compost metagenome]